MKYGIIGAMDVEIQALKKNLLEPETAWHAGVEFCTGFLYGHPVVLAQSGVGKVSAAICAQAMIDHFAPDRLINTGIAAGIGEPLQILDVVVAREVAEHDMDTSAVGDPPGFLSGPDQIYLPADPALAGALAQAASLLPSVHVYQGVIASGDQFISNEKQKKRIHNLFHALAAEMEGGAVGHVCYQNQVPFGVVRTISDGGDASAPMDYPLFKEKAAAQSLRLLEALFTKILVPNQL